MKGRDPCILIFIIVFGLDYKADPNKMYGSMVL